MSLLEQDQVEHLCEALKLQAVADQYIDLAQRAANEETSYIQFLAQILKAEQSARLACSRQTMVKMAGFPAIKTLDAYDFKFAVGAPKKAVMTLADLAFQWRPRLSRPVTGLAGC